MYNFNFERKRLIESLDFEISQNRENSIFVSLKNILLEQTSINKLNGAISRIVIDSLDFNLKVSGELINFESNFRNLSYKIKSKELKNLFKFLIENNFNTEFVGKAWDNCNANWYYFDCSLNIGKIKSKLSFGHNIVLHENLDNKSGLERGFIDKTTGEAIIGKIN